MTYETLRFLRVVLDRITLNVSDEGFIPNALNIINAIHELDAAIKEAESHALNTSSPALYDESVPGLRNSESH